MFFGFVWFCWGRGVSLATFFGIRDRDSVVFGWLGAHSTYFLLLLLLLGTPLHYISQAPLQLDMVVRQSASQKDVVEVTAPSRTGLSENLPPSQHPPFFPHSQAGWKKFLEPGQGSDGREAGLHLEGGVKQSPPTKLHFEHV